MDILETAIERRKETFRYTIVGVLTSTVNLFTFFLLKWVFNVNYIASNTAAWIATVVVAYLVNKFWVFKTEPDSFKQVFKEFVMFVNSRIFPAWLIWR